MQLQSYWEKIKAPSCVDQYRLNADGLSNLIYEN